MPTNRFFKVAAALLPALLAFSACGDDDSNADGRSSSSSSGGSDADGSTPPWSDPPPPVDLARCEGEAAPPDKSSNYLLITESQLAKLRAAAASNSPDFARLKANVEQWLGELNAAKTGGENAALLYLLTGDVRYAQAAYAWAEDIMSKDVIGPSNAYLEFGDYMRVVALTLNWAKDGLEEAQIRKMADYLHASCHELWFDPRGSKWALSDDSFPAAGNNFRMAFIEGTAFAGYALQALGDSRGTQWVNTAIDKLERKGGVFDYLNTYQSGGDWLEGTNYGQRSKQRLYRALAVIASMGGKNYFNENPFFANSIVYAVYQAQPKNQVLYPGGDLARSAKCEISGYDREYVEIATYWLCDSPARRLGQYYLTTVAPTYEDSKRSFDYWGAIYLDLLYRLDIPAFDVTTLPLSYRAAGTNWVNARSGWDEHATSVSISGSPIFSQSHQHADMGSFLIWKEDWLAVNPETFEGKGPFWPPEAHQGLFVPKREPRYDGGPVPGLTKFADKGAAVYVQVDNSNLYLIRPPGAGLEYDPLVNEHTREIVYLRPDTVFVFDRVDAKPESLGYSVNFHLPGAPTKAGETFTATNGAAGITVAPLLGGTATSKEDTEFGSPTHRVEVTATGAVTRFLTALEVSSSGAPALDPTVVGAAGSVRGALWKNTVVLFSDLPRGATPTLPLTYTVPGTGSPTHLIANMAPSTGYKVTATRDGGSTTVTIEAGGDVMSDAEGLLVATP